MVFITESYILTESYGGGCAETAKDCHIELKQRKWMWSKQSPNTEGIDTIWVLSKWMGSTLLTPNTWVRGGLITWRWVTHDWQQHNKSAIIPSKNASSRVRPAMAEKISGVSAWPWAPWHWGDGAGTSCSNWKIWNPGNSRRLGSLDLGFSHNAIDYNAQRPTRGSSVSIRLWLKCWLCRS